VPIEEEEEEIAGVSKKHGESEKYEIILCK
jgi:hypothetical protein